MRTATRLGAVTAATVAALALAPAMGATAHAVGTATNTSASSASSEYKCTIHKQGSYWYAGQYYGMKAVPSASTITPAGIEAQCLLKDSGFYKGAIDGYFGPQSQEAMKGYQRLINQQHGVGLAVDGWPGPQSWPWLRR